MRSSPGSAVAVARAFEGCSACASVDWGAWRHFMEAAANYDLAQGMIAGAALAYLWGAPMTPANPPAGAREPASHHWWDAASDVADAARDHFQDTVAAVQNTGIGLADRAKDATSSIGGAIDDPDIWKPLAGASLIVVADIPGAILTGVCIASAGGACLPAELYDVFVMLPATYYGVCLITGDNYPGTGHSCEH